MNMFLEEEFGKSNYADWKPGGPDLSHFMAVLHGKKPAALIDVTGEYGPYETYELIEFAKEKGAKVLFHTKPTPCHHVNDQQEITSHSVMYTDYLFVYHDEELLDQYKAIARSHATGDITDDEHNRRLGHVLGYSARDIEAHIAFPLPSGLPAINPMPLVDFLTQYAHPAVYDELAEDPILCDVLPKRAVSQRPLG
jgi:hypothetical protein